MTAPKDRPEIQRWVLYDRGVSLRLALEKRPDGEFVLYTDHLRHLKLAQIAVLEEMTFGFTGAHWVDRAKAKIAALRKEMEQ